MLGEDISTVNPPHVVQGCKLTNSNYRTGQNYYLNQSCFSPVPLTAANSAYCDQRLGAGICSNIRGDLARNSIVGPGFFNVDFSLFKNNYIHKVSETTNLQFRAEFFNVLNHTNFAPPPLANLVAFTNLGQAQTSTFGQLTRTQGQDRIIQLALKLIW